MAKKAFLFCLMLAFLSISAFGAVSYRISELDALRRLPFEVKEKGKNTIVPEFDSRAAEYVVVVSSMPEELKELRKAGAETGNSWKLLIVADDNGKEKIVLGTLASTFHYFDKDSKQTNSFVLVGEQKLVALITRSEDVAKLAKYKEKKFFLLCHDGHLIFYPRTTLGMVWEPREINNVDQENLQPKGAVFKDGTNGVRYVKKDSEADKKIEKLVYLVADSSELGHGGTVLTEAGYKRAEKTFWEKTGGALKKEVIGAVPFVSFGLRYGNFAVSNLIKSSSLNVASSFVGRQGQQRTTGLNIYCDNQVAQEVFYRNMVDLRRANSLVAQEILALKQGAENQLEQLAHKQKKIEELEAQIILTGSALAEQQRQNQEREFVLTQVLRATREDAENLQKENDWFKGCLTEVSLKIAKLQKRESIQSAETADLKKAYFEIKNSTAFFEARLISLEQKRENKYNLEIVNLKKEKEQGVKKSDLIGLSNLELGQILPASIFGILLLGMFCGNHSHHSLRTRKFNQPVRRGIKTKKSNKNQTKKEKKMRKNLSTAFVVLIFAFIFSFSNSSFAIAQTTNVTNKIEIYTPQNNPELFDRLTKQNPELYLEVLENPRQVIMEVGGVFRPYVLAPGVKVLASKDGNIKYAQCGNPVIDLGGKSIATETKEKANEQEALLLFKSERERFDMFLIRHFEEARSSQKGQQELWAKQLEQQSKFLEFLSVNQKAQSVPPAVQPFKEKFVWWRDGVNLANLGLNIADLIVDVRNGGGKRSSDTILNLTQSLTNTNTSNPVVDVIATLSGGNNTANNTANNTTTAQGGNSTSTAQGGNSTSIAHGGNAQGGNSNANANNDNKVSNDNPVNVTNTSSNNNSASNDNKISNTGTNSNNNSNQQNQGQAQNQASTNNNSGGAGNPIPPPLFPPPQLPPPPDPVVNVGNGNTNNTHNSGNNSGNGNVTAQPVPPSPPPPPPTPQPPPPPSSN